MKPILMQMPVCVSSVPPDPEFCVRSKPFEFFDSRFLPKVYIKIILHM